MTHRAHRTSLHPNYHRKLLAAAVMAACVAGGAERAAAGPSVIELSSLAAGDGSTGFVLNGVTTGDRSGASVSSAGDVNGDGIDDLIIGALFADPNGGQSGESYVVFGNSAGFGAEFELSTLSSGDGSTGFALNGVAGGDNSGLSVSGAGDINGDNIDDLIIGAFGADPNGSYSGESYVVFGSTASFGAEFELSTLSNGDGSTGFALNGVAGGDYSGVSVSGAGDVNGDGLDDLIVGAYLADPNGSNSGESYVVFGSTASFGAEFELSTLSSGDGSTGFALNGVTAVDLSGLSVSGAGDVNGDGIDDLIIGAFGADPNGSLSGESYVVFGSTASFGAEFELSTLSSGDGSAGFALNGVTAGDISGRSVSGAGDVNGDGIDDLIIGARDADPNGTNSGESYVVFGSTASFGAEFELSTLSSGDGSTGFALNGVTASDQSGFSVSGVGDVNDDGIDDLIIGARLADPNGNYSGQSYVVFGSSTGFGATFELSTLSNGDGSTGFALNGVTTSDFSGGSVSGAGDVNGDNIDDLIIGAFGADPNGSLSGESYVVFGVSSATVTAPEPSSVSLLAAGLSLLGLSWRRRRQANTLNPSQASDNGSTP